MTQLETFSTAGLEPRRKIEFWNDAACASFTPIVSEPVDLRNFNGRLTRTRLGDMRLGEVYSDAQTVRHLRSHVARTRAPMFFLQMQLDGDSINRQDGRAAKLGPGDFTLCDTTRPYEMQFERVLTHPHAPDPTGAHGHLDRIRLRFQQPHPFRPCLSRPLRGHAARIPAPAT
jgi:hypothetical protein